MRHMKRLALVLSVILILSITVFAEVGVDRYDQIFDATQDAGKLTARFLKLTTRSDDKSGDSTILTSPDGKVMIVDTGNPSTFLDIDNALKALGITRIDYLVASHPHVDHVGSMAQLIRAYEIGTVYTTEVEYPTSHYRNYMEALAETGTPHIILVEGDTLMFGDHVLVEVFHPAPGIEYYDGYPEGSTQFINNLSLLMKLTYGDSSFLFTGDLYTAAEREIAAKYGERLRSDVLKVPHHGAGTSSSRPFRDAISPQISVMMHDSIDELRIIRNYVKGGAANYITSVDGSVMVSTTGDGEYTVISQFDRVSDFLD
ncbi:MAG TPA: MBL fold metallo-hydrolase [Limnochordia bacterium]|nr:MBL fold metallo-hydrolase [Limnochordia bacterium]